VYKGKNIEEFKQKIIGVTNGNLKDLSKSGHVIAEKRGIEIVGKNLLAAYAEACAIASNREKFMQK
jgi:hypothetical protein